MDRRKRRYFDLPVVRHGKERGGSLGDIQRGVGNGKEEELSVICHEY